MKSTKAQVQPTVLIVIIVIALILFNQSTNRNVEVDLSKFASCSDINITVKENTIVAWTNSGIGNNPVYYMTFTEQNEIIEIRKGVIYKVLYQSPGKADYACGTSRYNLYKDNVTIVPWWDMFSQIYS